MSSWHCRWTLIPLRLLDTLSVLKSLCIGILFICVTFPIDFFLKLLVRIVNNWWLQYTLDKFYGPKNWHLVTTLWNWHLWNWLDICWVKWWAVSLQSVMSNMMQNETFHDLVMMALSWGLIPVWLLNSFDYCKFRHEHSFLCVTPCERFYWAFKLKQNDGQCIHHFIGKLTDWGLISSGSLSINTCKSYLNVFVEWLNDGLFAFQMRLKKTQTWILMILIQSLIQWRWHVWWNDITLVLVLAFPLEDGLLAFQMS